MIAPICRARACARAWASVRASVRCPCRSSGDVARGRRLAFSRPGWCHGPVPRGYRRVGAPSHILSLCSRVVPAPFRSCRDVGELAAGRRFGRVGCVVGVWVGVSRAVRAAHGGRCGCLCAHYICCCDAVPRLGRLSRVCAFAFSPRPGLRRFSVSVFFFRHSQANAIVGFGDALPEIFSRILFYAESAPSSAERIYFLELLLSLLESERDAGGGAPLVGGGAPLVSSARFARSFERACVAIVLAACVC